MDNLKKSTACGVILQAVFYGFSFSFLYSILDVDGIFQITNFAVFRLFEDVWYLLVFC